MSVAIASVGLATAQGGASDVVNGADLRFPARLPWPSGKWAACQRAYRAVGIEPSLCGKERWVALAELALKECLGGQRAAARRPVLVASCNGAAGGFDADAWRCAFEVGRLLEGGGLAEKSWPIFSASCSSGLQALYVAKLFLLAGYSDEVVVLAVDILSAASHDNFEVLRVLSERPTPWQQTSDGFMLGEAAVALRLVRAEDAEKAPCLNGPIMGSDLAGHDGLRAPLSRLRPEELKLILGQGTGPFQSDEAELAALRAAVRKSVPLATPLAHFGHTLGASSLLSVALAALAWKAEGPLPSLSMPARSAMDGRPLFDGSPQKGDVLVTCRAMSGACTVASVGSAAEAPLQRSVEWQASSEQGALMHPVLRRIATEAVRYRPQAPPDILVVRMDEPLLPDERASIGGRLLPSAVLELTPGFVPQLIARRWGFAGGALCLVGKDDGERLTSEMVEACEESGLVVSRVRLRGGANERTVEWDG